MADAFRGKRRLGVTGTTRAPANEERPVPNRGLPTILLTLLAAASLSLPGHAADPNLAMMEGLKPFAPLVGTWEGMETNIGWKDAIQATWGFRDKDGRVAFQFEHDGQRGSLVDKMMIGYDPPSGKYVALIVANNRKVLRFTGEPNGPGSLRFIRDDETDDGIDRLDVSLVRGANKLIYIVGRRLGRSDNFETLAQVELFRQGVPAEDFREGPYCVVTGGAGRVEVEHGGQTYHVACEETKKEFLRRPDFYIAQAKATE